MGELKSRTLPAPSDSAPYLHRLAEGLSEGEAIYLSRPSVEMGHRQTRARGTTNLCTILSKGGGERHIDRTPSAAPPFAIQHHTSDHTSDHRGLRGLIHGFSSGGAISLMGGLQRQGDLRPPVVNQSPCSLRSLPPFQPLLPPPHCSRVSWSRLSLLLHGALIRRQDIPSQGVRDACEGLGESRDALSCLSFWTIICHAVSIGWFDGPSDNRFLHICLGSWQQAPETWDRRLLRRVGLFVQI